jgi:hypothetical protein
VIYFVVQVRNHATYTQADLRRQQLPSPDKVLVAPNNPPAVLEPALYHVSITTPAVGSGQAQTISFAPGSPFTTYPGYTYPPSDMTGLGRLSEGCYAVISDDGFDGQFNVARFNGIVTRLGKKVPSGSPTYEIAPGSEIPGVPATGLDCLVWVVGRGYRYNGSFSDPSAGYDGLPQDIGVYVSYVRVN